MARLDGRVVFVRHALPGERVRVEITGSGGGGRFLRADAVEVLEPAPGRRPAPCPVAATCGGCDWQHATPAASRALKAAVVTEALTRFAHVEDLPTVEVLEVPGANADGLGWRTRGTLSVAADGRPGFRAPRSHEVVAAGGCPQLHERTRALDLFGRSWPAGGRVGFVAPSAGEPLAFDPRSAPTDPVQEQAAGREWSVAADGFWQVHPGAADALVEHVLRLLDPRPGERVVDLYAGAGLFGIALAEAVSAGASAAPGSGSGSRRAAGSVTCVEGDRTAVRLARVNAGDLPVRVVRAPVARWVSDAGAMREADLVVLDPPRAGAGAAVVRAIAAARPRAVAYVACDPVALARDVATFRTAGMELAEVVALDLFPTTQHVECIALLVTAPG